jgi:hypothetical protein
MKRLFFEKNRYSEYVLSHTKKLYSSVGIEGNALWAVFIEAILSIVYFGTFRNNQSACIDASRFILEKRNFFLSTLANL